MRRRSAPTREPMEDELVARTKTKNLTSAAGDATDKVGSAAETAMQAVSDAVSDVRDRLGPVVEDARDRIAPVVEDARDAIVPAVTSAVTAGKDKGHDAAVRLGLVEEPKKKHRLRKLLVALGIAGAVAFVVNKLRGGGSTEYVAPRDAAPTAPLASPETVESPVPTTPDEPLEEKQV